MDTLDPKQKEELERLNRALEEQKFLPDDKKLLRRKMYNPQTGELQLFVDNGKGGVKLTSVNLLGD
jgi:hypothetical protein